jgi:enamine deaminase RidA (YjgF/YER057c/UK114 family)
MMAMRDAIITSQWRQFYEATGIPAAVRVGQTVRLTGHTGTRPDGSFSADPVEQLRQTFANIADTLAAAGCTWSDVEEITAYHIGLQAQSELVLEVAAQFMTAPFPAWSAVGVTELYEPDAVVELRVIASTGSQ